MTEHRFRQSGIHTSGEWSITQIVSEFSLSMARVFAALAYYYGHPVEIDRALDQDEILSEGRDIHELEDRINRQKGKV